MTARVLVVDDIAANVKLLEAKLSAEYFDVVTASNGPDALKAVEAQSRLHEAQLLTYLKLSRLRLGFLLNFNAVQMRHGLRRFVR